MTRFIQDWARTCVAALMLLTSLLPGSAVAQTDGLPPGPGMPGAIMRDPVTGRIGAAPPVLEIHVCVDMADDPACETVSLQSALSGISRGGTVILHAGEYRQAARLDVHRTHIQALPGAALVGVAESGKGALVVTANDVVIEGLSCAGISVRDRNGACIRMEGRNLTLRRVHFHDSEQGLLAGGDTGLILVEDSRFENLGQGGQAHGIYVGGGELIIRRSVFISSKGEGHEIKSRAARTLVEDSIVASLNSRDSYLIDVPNGGDTIIRRNILQEGPASANNGAIAFAMEGDKRENSSILVENNVILMDRPGGIVVKAKSGHKATMTGNVIVGPTEKFRFGAVKSACNEFGNVCLAGRPELKARDGLMLPRINNLDKILAETGLW
ncbi:MAG: right-handed parallel beta-helix repeat-containing protein [Alphaproteobacteria bacterium]